MNAYRACRHPKLGGRREKEFPVLERQECYDARKSDKKKQTFSYNAPTALSVMLVGDLPIGRRIPSLSKSKKSGVWKTSVSLAPGTYHYRFLVDGQWCDDPECSLRVPNPYGEHNSVREVT